MKKNLLLLTLSFVSAFGFCNNPYRVDENKVDELFKASQDVSDEISALYCGEHRNIFMVNKCSSLQESDKQSTAGIIAIVQFVTATGFIPVYRFMLGTGGNDGKIFGLYCITCGGLGVLPLIDGIMLLTDEGGNKYVNNGKFIMWME